MFTYGIEWKTFFDIIGQDDRHLLTMYGVTMPEKRSESIFIDFQDSWLKNHDWPPMGWHHICIVYNNTKGNITVTNKEGSSLEYPMDIKNSTMGIKTVSIMKRGWTDQELKDLKDKEADGDEHYGKVGSMVGRMTDFNLWNFAFSFDLMENWLACRNSSQGNLIAWNKSSWTMNNITASNISQTEIQNSVKLLMFPPLWKY